MTHQDKIIAFLLRHPKYFINSISEYYPFTKAELHKFKDKVSWWLISNNLNIEWNYELISEFKEQINWKAFTVNSRAFEDISLIDIFSEKIIWNSSDEKTKHYTIASNEGIRWSKEMIEKYASKINFEALSENGNVDWTVELLDKYENKWNFIYLGRNESVPWTVELFEKYLKIDYINKDYEYDDFLIESIIVSNRNLVNFDFIEKYKDILNWRHICYNDTLPWKEKNLLVRWIEYIDWSEIAANEFFFRDDPNFFQNNFDKWKRYSNFCIDSFCRNRAFPWSKALIEKYKYLIDWEKLCTYSEIAWDIDLINCFLEYIVWGGFSPIYNYNPITREKVLDEDNQEIKFGLIDNVSVMWSIDLLECFETKLTPRLMFYNSTIWEKAFMPFVDEEMIDTIIQSINKTEINDNTIVSSDSQFLSQIDIDSTKSICPMNNTYNWEDFQLNWGKEFNDVKAISYYINTYSKSKQNILKIDFLNPEDLENAQKDWLQLISKYTNQIDIDFFKPYWIPIEKNNFEPFIDLSSPNFTLFNCNYFSSTHWHKTDILNDINELLIDLDGNDTEMEKLRTKIKDRQQRFYDELIAKLESEESENTKNQD